MKLSLLIFSIALCITANGQDFQWAKSTGGEIVNGITVDGSENIYTIGSFRESADFDPGPGTTNSYAGFYSQVNVSKLNSSGDLVWAKQLGGAETDNGEGIAVDASGNVYVTGTFVNTADFDPGAGTTSFTALGSYISDIFVVKLDASGNLVWARQMGGSSHDYSYSIAIDASGNVYTTGAFEGTADFDPGSGTANLTTTGKDFFISKLDASGNFVWVKQIAGNNYTAGKPHDLNIDASGNLYITGTYNGTVDFDPGANVTNLTSTGGLDIFICKLNSSGDLIWAKKMGGSSDEEGYSITIDASGNVYTTGYFEGAADFDPNANSHTLTSAGSSDIFISKLDGSGNFVWAKQIGGSSDDMGRSLITDASGSVYLTGSFEGTVDFNPGTGITSLVSNGNIDIFICKLDGSGNYNWATSFGDNLSDSGSDLAMSSSGNLYTTGNYHGTVDFDPSTGTSNLISSLESYVFISKISQLSTNISDAIDVSSLSLYPNPTNDRIILHATINKQGVTYQLMDVSGKEITKGNIVNEFTQISLENLSVGLYLLNIEGEFLKIIKK